MIVKKIPRLIGKDSGSRIREVKLLVEYLRSPEKSNPYDEALLRYLRANRGDGEQIERSYHQGCRHLISKEPEAQKVEMMALIARAGSGEPLAHWLLSWKHNERPTPEQIDEAAGIFLAEMGWGHLCAIYAAHADTHNIHLHIAVNRFDPQRGKMVKVDGGKRWDLNAAHRAVAIIVDRQGWASEDDARYAVVDGRPVFRKQTQQRSGETSVDTNARAYEQRTGLKSVMRIMIEEARPILLGAKSWAEIHYRLGQIGMRCVATRQGLKVALGDQHVKASSIHRQCSLKQLVARLESPYKERLPSVPILTRMREVEPMPNVVGALEYRQWRQARAAELKQKLAAVDRERDRRIAAAERQRLTDKRALAALNDDGRSPERILLGSVIDEKAEAAAREALRWRTNAAKRARSELAAASDLEHWLRRLREDGLAQRWRDRAKAEAEYSLTGTRPQPSHRSQIDGFEARCWEDCTLWSRSGQPTAFLEFHDRIEMVEMKDREAILAAYHLASDLTQNCEGWPGSRNWPSKPAHGARYS